MDNITKFLWNNLTNHFLSQKKKSKANKNKLINKEQKKKKKERKKENVSVRRPFSLSN